MLEHEDEKPLSGALDGGSTSICDDLLHGLFHRDKPPLNGRLALL